MKQSLYLHNLRKPVFDDNDKCMPVDASHFHLLKNPTQWDTDMDSSQSVEVGHEILNYGFFFCKTVV